MNEFNNQSDNYIEELLHKLSGVKDKELNELVLKLIDEREYLIKTLNIDPLTGTYNRRILDKIRVFSSVVICDLDNFKMINDTYGHSVGDIALQLVAKTLTDSCRSNDYVCRYGGDEFVVVFCGIPQDTLKERLTSIKDIINDISLSMGIKITLSIGVANYREGLTLGDVINHADRALYVSKESGKNQISYYDEVVKMKKR